MTKEQAKELAYAKLLLKRAIREIKFVAQTRDHRQLESIYHTLAHASEHLQKYEKAEKEDFEETMEVLKAAAEKVPPHD